VVLATSGPDVIVYGSSGTTGAGVVLRFDRRLSLLSETPLVPSFLSPEKGTPIATDGSGRRSIAWAPLGPTTIAQIDPQGGLLPGVMLGSNPVNVVAAADGGLFATTRIPLSTPGPVYAIDTDGAIQWSNAAGPLLYAQGGYPGMLAATSGGELWIGGTGPLPGGFWYKAFIVRIDTETGGVSQMYQLPDKGDHTQDELLAQLTAAPDGTLWAMHSAVHDVQWTLTKTDGEAMLQSFQIDGGGSGGTPADLRIDGEGRLYIRSSWNQDLPVPEYATKLYRYDPAAPSSIDAVWQLGGFIRGWAFGATSGEAFFVVTPITGGSPIERLERLNLVTGVKSSIPLDPTWFNNEMGFGDPSGFIYANIVDRQGDVDGDGTPNGLETAAGSNPYDPLSRPDGPKVYISFAQSNGALILKYVDPDGILNPTGGLNLSSLSLVSSQHGQIFNFLLPFLTFVQVSPDQTEVTALFGALPIPADMKWQFEATVTDKTGATGWDWQITRPGDL
jgi:hypothetical protein